VQRTLPLLGKAERKDCAGDRSMVGDDIRPSDCVKSRPGRPASSRNVFVFHVIMRYTKRGGEVDDSKQNRNSKTAPGEQVRQKALCDYVINPAVGCLHGCTFCYVPATPTVRMRARELAASGVSDPQLGWGSYLFYRANVVQALERQLAGKRTRTWKKTPSGRGVVLMSSTTDPFLNKRTGNMTTNCVRLLLERDRRVRILTRSPSWVRYGETVELCKIAMRSWA